MENSRRERLLQSKFIDDGLTLDINRLLQRFDILPGKHLAGTLRWVTDQGSFSVGYEASLLNRRRAWLRLSYTVADPPSGLISHQDYRIRLATTRTHLGGLRWWFRCPITQLRTAKLYLPSAGLRFLSRRAYGAPRSRRCGLLAHVCEHLMREHLAWDRESRPNPVGRGDPASFAGRPASFFGGATRVAKNLQGTRRIYAERLGRPMARPRRLVPEDSC
jgi:hypothetical protein